MIEKSKILIVLHLIVLSNVLFTSIAMEKETVPESKTILKTLKRSMTYKRHSRSSSQSSSMSNFHQTPSNCEGSTSISSREGKDFRRNSSESEINETLGVMNKEQQESETMSIQRCQFLDLNSNSTKQKDVLQVDWRVYSGDQIIDELTRRDVTLIQSLSVDHIDKFSKDQNDKSDTIQKLAKAFDGTTKWLTSVILSETDISKRRKLAQFFLLMGRSLYIRKNYHTAMQFMLAFMNPEVGKLFEIKGVNSLKFEEFFCMFNPLKNYSQYRQHLFSDNVEYTSYFPAFPIFVQDVVIANESNNQHALPEMIRTHCLRWGGYPLPEPNEKNGEVLNFVSRFSELLEEVVL